MAGRRLLLETKHFPSFNGCPDENDVDFGFYRERGGFLEHRMEWCLIGEITRDISFMRPGVIVKDKDDDEFPIHFYLDNGSGNTSKIKQHLNVGDLICVRYATVHSFLDGQVGLRLEDVDLKSTTFIPKVTMQSLQELDATGCLMEYYQNSVLKRNKEMVRLNDQCWCKENGVRCGQTTALKRCGNVAHFMTFKMTLYWLSPQMWTL